MVSEDAHGAAFHFEGEVLVVLPTEPFPWAIWPPEHWTLYSEMEEFARGLEWD